MHSFRRGRPRRAGDEVRSVRSILCWRRGRSARARASPEPLSFWGGVEVETGNIVDNSHPDLGRCVAGRILVMPGGRGSSSSSSVLAEAIRRGPRRSASSSARADPVLTVGSIVGRVP